MFRYTAAALHIVFIYIALFWTFSCNDKVAEEDTLHLFNVGLYPRPGDIPVLNRKVFRGMRVTVQEHPYIASIRRNYAHYSMAVIIAKSIILTVAHPLQNVPINELGVVVGENYADRGTVVLTVVLVIVNSEFDPYTLKADLALVRIYESILFKTTIKPVLGFSDSKSYLVYKKAFVTGWGRCDLRGNELCLPRSSKYYPDEKLDPMLKTISFFITRLTRSCEAYKRLYDINMQPGMFCLGYTRQYNPAAPCMAVPGAPLVVDTRLVGLQSWGFACGYRYDLPIVYTDIRKYYDWISHNVDVLYNVTNNNLIHLFQATKSYILSEWLNKTRDFKVFHNHLDEDIQPLEIDKLLAPLKGNIYDIRNYVNEGKYNMPKHKMYDLIRVLIGRAEKAKEISNALSDLELDSFIKYETDMDSDDDTITIGKQGSYNDNQSMDNEGVYRYDSEEDLNNDTN